MLQEIGCLIGRDVPAGHRSQQRGGLVVGQPVRICGPAAVGEYPSLLCHELTFSFTARQLNAQPEPDQEQRCTPGHGLRAHHAGTAGRTLLLGQRMVERGLQNEPCDCRDAGVGSVQVRMARRHWKFRVERQRLRVTGWQGVRKSDGQGTRPNRERRRIQATEYVRAECSKGLAGEPADLHPRPDACAQFGYFP